MRIALIVAAGMLAGCTPVEMRGDVTAAVACKADALGDLVGKRASDARADVMQARSGAKSLRWIAPDTAVTMDFRPDRLNVYVDGKGRIERFSCS